MKRIILGKTGIEAVRFGFGGIPIQRVSEKQAVEVVKYALKKGMDFVDTSRMYTTSENRIGRALKEINKKVTLATKSFSRSSDGIQKDIETSLKELQTDYIDLYQCHAVGNEEEYRQVTSSNGALQGLQKAFKWVFSCPDILVLAGVEEKSYIDQNWEIFLNDWVLTDEDEKKIGEIRKEFDRKFCRRCDYCLPCTVEIPIQFALGVRSMVKRMGPGILKQPMFQVIREKAVNCTECGDCMERCPYGLPIPDMIKENLEWIDDLMTEDRP
ncbi:MAG: aldo/keto reductase [Acidobacteriota bacterium]